MKYFFNTKQKRSILTEIEVLSKSGSDRYEFWISIINKFKCKRVLEIGVLNGDFAIKLLTECELIRKYYMIDPWQKLDNWNKPCNVSNENFEKIYNEILLQTNFAKEKRVILRGRTAEMIHRIKDNSLDFIYIDGDHTLRGISIDLINAWNKIKQGGLIGGDDFSETIWQHSRNYEPTLIFPFAVYFAEAVGAQIFALPFQQFLIKKSDVGFRFNDLTGKYNDQTLRNQFWADKLGQSKL